MDSSPPPDRPPPPDPRARRPATAYRELLIVFGATWLLLVFHGALGRDLVIAGVTLEKPELSAYLRRWQGAPFTAEAQAAIEPEATLPTAAPADLPSSGVTASAVAPLARGPQRILLLGDSMVEVLEPRLADYCLENGHRLFPAIWYASTTASWASGPELEDLLREIKPTLVVVALGSSELTARRIDQRERHVRAILQRVGPRPLLWIGPPNWREDTGINAMLARVLGAGRFFSSATLDLERGADGIHPNAVGGAKWAEAFASWVREDGARAIALAPPTRVAPRVPARVYAPPR